jgi:phthiocerol/phenolphthiocerol synthesis type-I polyketide synthase D
MTEELDLDRLIDQLSVSGRETLVRALVARGVSGVMAPAQPVAVIGLGCRYPGGVTSPEEFWHAVAHGADGITAAPLDRWPVGLDGIDGGEADVASQPLAWGGFLADAADFDAEFFSISPAEAVAMDPQQRVLLEVAWEALEHAGLPPRDLAGTATSVFVGIAAPDYLVERLHDEAARQDPYTILGGVHSAAVGRLAYLLDLHGPAVAIDTACSSSLVALHLACQSLWVGDADVALAGGVHVISSPMTSVALQHGGIADGDGRCKAFDASAQGIVRAEGCGVLVLKRLTDAERDNDRILGVVRGSAVNQDGHSNGLTAPSVRAQREVLHAALARAGVEAATVGMVEAHGTGTPLGDPIEADAIVSVYGVGDSRCALGSVKTNFGHCEEAAGVAGAIKALLSMVHGAVPPNLHFSRLNPQIHLEGTRLFVPTSLTSWPITDDTRRAAVSSFGLGGTNAHVVFESPPALDASALSVVSPPPSTAERSTPDAPVLLAISSGTAEGVAADARRLARWLSGDGATVPLLDVADNLARRRSHLAVRGAVVVDTRDSAVEALQRLADGGGGAGVHLGRIPDAGARAPVFVFSGHGSQWTGMGRELLATEPAFAARIAEIAPLLHAESGLDLISLLVEDDIDDAPIDVVQPAIYAMQLALASTWAAHGLEPEAVIGHSMGEVSAAVLAGALTPAEGARIICLRSKLIAHDPHPKGTLALVELPSDRVASEIESRPGLFVAADCSPCSTVVAGTAEQVDAAMRDWRVSGLSARRLGGSQTAAAHTPMLHHLLAPLIGGLETLTPAAPRIDYYSATTPDPRRQPQFDAAYWATNLREPVRLDSAVAAALDDGFGIFVEVSPHPVVSSFIEETVQAHRAERSPSEHAVVVATLQRAKPARTRLLNQIAAAHCAGAAVRWWQASAPASHVSLPTRSWRHRRYWLRENGTRRSPSRLHPLLGEHLVMPGEPVRHVWQTRLDPATVPWLADHRVSGTTVLPGTAYIEMGLAAAYDAFGGELGALVLEDCEFHALLPLDVPRTLTTELTTGASGQRELASVVRVLAGTGGHTQEHMSARVSVFLDSGAVPVPADVDAAALSQVLRDDHSWTTVAPDDLYARIRACGGEHGPAFTGLVELRVRRQARGAEVVTVVSCPEAATPSPRLCAHPALMDIALQGCGAALLNDPDGVYLPAGVTRLRLPTSPFRPKRTHAIVVPLDDGNYRADVRVLDASGRPLLIAEGVTLRRSEAGRLPVTVADKLYQRSWQAASLPSTPGDPRCMVVVGPTQSECAWAKQVATELSQLSHTVDIVAATAVSALYERRSDQGTPPVDVVFAPERHGDALADLSAATSLVRLVSSWSKPPRLWLLTRGGQRVRDSDRPDPCAAALRGLWRTLAFEHPELRPVTVDLDTNHSESLAAAEAALEVTISGSHDELAWRNGGRLTATLGRAGARELPPQFRLVRAGDAYLITGGLTGLGLHTATVLAARRAGRVVLNARSSPSAQAQECIARLRAGGTDVRVVNGDIAEPHVACALVDAGQEDGVALRGVVHAAGDLDDSTVVNLTDERFARVWRPKVQGALSLYAALTAVDGVATGLDWIALYSSIGGLLGGAGQGNYAAANAALDALAGVWRAEGVPVCSIAWGGWSEVGHAKDLHHESFGLLNPAEGIAGLEAAVTGDRPEIAVMRLDAGSLPITNPEIADLPFFADLIQRDGDSRLGDSWPGPRALDELADRELLAAIEDRLAERVCRSLGFRRSELDVARPLVRLGMDSLQAVRLKNDIQADFAVILPAAALLQQDGVASLADEIAARRGDGPSRAAERARDAVSHTAASRARVRAVQKARRRGMTT